eukprot:XP_001709719.1 Hypothetical protein GL50803_32474 [Giardia lamblia ATCC 50803]
MAQRSRPAIFLLCCQKNSLIKLNHRALARRPCTPRTPH